LFAGRFCSRGPGFAVDDDTASRVVSIIFDHQWFMLRRTRVIVIELD